MSYLRKINPKANDEWLNVSQHEAGCCEGTTICGYTATLTGGAYSNITFTNVDGEVVTVNFENTATDAASLEAELRKVFVKPQYHAAGLTPQVETGLGTYEHADDWMGIKATDVVGGVELYIVTDMELASIQGQALTQDCTTQLVCECKFSVGVGVNVAGVLLSYNGSAGTALATGIYNTGDDGTLQTDVQNALTTEGAPFDTVTVVEDTNTGVFEVSVRLKALCNTLTWNSEGTVNCGCTQEFHQ